MDWMYLFNTRQRKPTDTLRNVAITDHDMVNRTIRNRAVFHGSVQQPSSSCCHSQDSLEVEQTAQVHNGVKLECCVFRSCKTILGVFVGRNLLQVNNEYKCNLICSRKPFDLQKYATGWLQISLHSPLVCASPRKLRVTNLNQVR